LTFLCCRGRKHEAGKGARTARGELRLDTLVQEELGEKPYRTIEGDVSLGLLVLCDHAENRIPEAYGSLGLRPEDLHRHIAYDLGAEGVATGLAESLGAPAILSRFSRLLIDPNRGHDDPTLIMQLSDGLVVPGNVGLSPAEIEDRIERFHRPYHAAIDRAVEAGIAAGKPPVLLSIHSFTQAWKGAARPWATAVLWDKDPRFPLPLLDGLRTIPDIEVGDNVPYSGQLKGDTLYRHATLRGLAHALVEVRQDLIFAAEGQWEWARHLARVVAEVLRTAPRLHAIEHFGSKTGPCEGLAKGCAHG
jgi:predicted N-formylglutamate amidohydrolase